MPTPLPPQTEQQLLQRANAIAGLTLAEIALNYPSVLPDNLRIEKGWIGQFIEQVLGASAGSLPQPDFPNLGIELKTIPIDRNGKPLESTYVSVVPLHSCGQPWHASLVRQKLMKVLIIPIVTTDKSELTQRRVASPILWSPSADQEAILQSDWEEAMEKVALGKLDQLNARFGQALQVRPKAAHSRVVTDAIGPQGQKIKTLPRGFYLRPQFTHQILRDHYYPT